METIELSILSQQRFLIEMRKLRASDCEKLWKFSLVQVFVIHFDQIPINHTFFYKNMGTLNIRTFWSADIIIFSLVYNTIINIQLVFDQSCDIMPL